MLWRYAKYAGLDVSVKGGALQRFADAGDTAAWAKTAMDWAAETGVLAGDGQGRLCPTASATRAQAAQILKNYLAWAEK